MQRTIIHVDMNSYYVSVEALYNPQLRGKPVAVAGDPTERHGIILAKSHEAKAFGIATGNPIWKAKQLCPDLILISPHYDRYLKMSQMAKEIYRDYTDQVETLGLDECWLDVTGSEGIFGDGSGIAETLHKRINKELGLGISVGISWNKIFAKLGSDYHKPHGTTVFMEREAMENKIWTLPADAMWGVGWATVPKLIKYGIHTIGDIAKMDHMILEDNFGKAGLMLWSFANGLDSSPVTDCGTIQTIKSVGNSTTTPKDLETIEDIKITLYLLSESVAERMRKQHFKCHTVQVWIRYDDMWSCERQATLSYAVSNSVDIFQLAFELVRKNQIPGKKIRGLGVRGCNLTCDSFIQESFMPEQIQSQKQDDLEEAIDCIRDRFGHFVIQRGLQLTDQLLSRTNPQEHIGFMNA